MDLMGMKLESLNPFLGETVGGEHVYVELVGSMKFHVDLGNSLNRSDFEICHFLFPKNKFES